MITELKDYLIMYYEIKRLYDHEHYPLRRISDYLKLNFRTVKKYFSMSPKEFERFAALRFRRSFQLDSYKEYIVSRLHEYPDTPASVIHDQLKEHFVYFPDVHPKTVYNYVMKLRSEYGIPKETGYGRQYFPVADLAPGEQAQVDFGEKKLRTGTGSFFTVYFFAIVLCYSRYKFVLFSDRRFTSQLAVEAHEKAFEFFGGMPKEIIYDQDCVFIHDENRGDYVMTDVFIRYQSCRPFKVTFCRSADPESKGKVENVIKYVKNNFLYNRPFVNIDILNTQAVEWLNRTGNKMVHNTTRKVPFHQWVYERSFLLAWHPVFAAPAERGYKVYKTNVIKYRGNTYSLPFGTYRGEESRVYLSETGDSIVIRDLEEKVLATHLIPEGVGHNVINTHHRRNSSIRLNELRKKVREFFRFSSEIDTFMASIDRLYPRYVRDQLTILLTGSEKAGLLQAEIALEFCLRNNITSCNDFKTILEKQTTKEGISSHLPQIKLLGEASADMLSRLEPGRSDINMYESFFNEDKNKTL